MAMGAAAVLTDAGEWPLRCANPSNGAYPIKPSTLAPRMKPCATTMLGAGEQADIDVEAKLGGKKGEGEERKRQKRVDFRLAQVQERSFGWTG